MCVFGVADTLLFFSGRQNQTLCWPWVCHRCSAQRKRRFHAVVGVLGFRVQCVGAQSFGARGCGIRREKPCVSFQAERLKVQKKKTKKRKLQCKLRGRRGDWEGGGGEGTNFFRVERGSDPKLKNTQTIKHDLTSLAILLYSGNLRMKIDDHPCTVCFRQF